MSIDRTGSVGCHGAHESHRHGGILRGLLAESGAATA